jgi:hypothetical protein
VIVSIGTVGWARTTDLLFHSQLPPAKLPSLYDGSRSLASPAKPDFLDAIECSNGSVIEAVRNSVLVAFRRGHLKSERGHKIERSGRGEKLRKPLRG